MNIVDLGVMPYSEALAVQLNAMSAYGKAKKIRYFWWSTRP